MIKHFKKYGWPYLFLALLTLLIISIFLELALPMLSSFDKDKGIPTLYNITLPILTLALICVAWIQLAGLSKISKADFLLRIDTRYCSAESVKARIIIHKFYCKTRNGVCEEVHIKKIANEIKKLGESSNDKDCENFISLLNFLDFLETAAYFSNKNYINRKEIGELCGNSIVYYYKIFKP